MDSKRYIEIQKAKAKLNLEKEKLLPPDKEVTEKSEKQIRRGYVYLKRR